VNRFLPALGALLFVSGSAPAAQPPSELIEKAKSILREVPLIDGHNDTPYQFYKRVANHLEKIDLRDTTELTPKMHTDLARMRQGGLGGQFWSVYVEQEDFPGDAAVTATVNQIDMMRRIVARYPDSLELASTAEDIVRIHRQGKVASMAGVEGGHSIGNSLGVLRQFYALGARSMTLTHSKRNDWADSGTDEAKHGGLTRFGEEVIREMNRLGMLVDLSHVSPETMRDALNATEAPVIFSHSATLALVDHPRNVPDDVLKLLPKNGGVVMVTFVPSFVNQKVRNFYADRKAEEERLKYIHSGDPARATREFEAWKVANPPPPATVADVADHIDHVRRIAGIDHIGIGSDFDGIETAPQGLDGVEDYPLLLAELLRRGYGVEDVKKIAGLNLLRVMRQAEAVGKRLQKERPPSDARIEELDGKKP
jgi:membrane dipeptidase